MEAIAKSAKQGGGAFAIIVDGSYYTRSSLESVARAGGDLVFYASLGHYSSASLISIARAAVSGGGSMKLIVDEDYYSRSTLERIQSAGAILDYL